MEIAEVSLTSFPPIPASAARLMWHALRWALRRPYVLRPAVWASIALAALVAAPLAYVAWPLLVAAPAIIGLFAVTALIGWRRVTAPSDRLLIYLTQFASVTELGHDASADHQIALRDRLAGDDLLAPLVDVRLIGAPLSEQEARTLLAESQGSVVVFGNVRAQVDQARWDATMLARWPSDVGGVAHTDGYGFATPRPREPNPDATRLPVDAESPLQRLVARTFDVRHAAALHGTLLAIVAQATMLAEEGDASATRAIAQSLLRRANDFRDTLAERARAQIAIGQDLAGEEYDARKRLAALERAARTGAEHADLWSHCQSICFYEGLYNDAPLPRRRVRYAEAAAKLDSSAMHIINLAFAYLQANQLDDAERTIAELSRTEPPAVHADVKEIHGHIALMRGDTSAAKQWFHSAMRLGGETPTRLARLGSVLQGQGGTAAARRVYSRALRRLPVLSGLTRQQLFLYAWLMSGLVNCDDKRVLRQNKFLASILWPRPGWVRLQRALAVFVLRRQPQNVPLLDLSGRLAVTTGRYPEATRVFALLFILGQEPRYLAWLTMNLFLEGNVASAERNLLLMVQLDPFPDGPRVSQDAMDDQRVRLLFEPLRHHPNIFNDPRSDTAIASMMRVFPDASERVRVEMETQRRSRATVGM